MSENDMPRMQLGDVVEALGLLTRIPVNASGNRAVQSAWAWPIAGVIVAFLAVLTGWIATLLGVPPMLAAALTLVTQIVATGALHEDGLADCADGFWGGLDRAKRLAIMKDSRIGTYGVVVLVLSLLLRWSAITILIEQHFLLGGLVTAAALSRVPMVALMALVEPARPDGLSHSVGRPTHESLLLASAAAMAIAMLFAGFAAIPVAVIVAGLSFGTARIASQKIGGQTGDVLGASQQIAEIAALVTLVSIL